MSKSTENRHLMAEVRARVAAGERLLTVARDHGTNTSGVRGAFRQEGATDVWIDVLAADEENAHAADRRSVEDIRTRVLSGERLLDIAQSMGKYRSGLRNLFAAEGRTDTWNDLLRLDAETAAEAEAVSERARRDADLAATRERAAPWVGRVRSGETLSDVARDVGLTRERIRQIVLAAGLMPEVQRIRATRGEEERRAREAAAEAKRAHQRELARTTAPEEDVTRFDREWSNEAIVESVREWLAAGGSGLGPDWDGSPSLVLICNRIGWNEAIRRAGGTPVRENAAPRADRIPEDVVVGHVVEFLRDDTGEPWGAASYGRWASRNAGAPSLGTVRNRFDMRWLPAKQAALDVIAAEDRAAATPRAQTDPARQPTTRRPGPTPP